MHVEKVTRPLTREERLDYAARRNDARKYGGQIAGIAASVGAYNTPTSVTEYVITDHGHTIIVRADGEAQAIEEAARRFREKVVSDWWLNLPDTKRQEYRQRIFDIDTELNAAEYFYANR